MTHELSVCWTNAAQYKYISVQITTILGKLGGENSARVIWREQNCRYFPTRSLEIVRQVGLLCCPRAARIELARGGSVIVRVDNGK